MEPASSASQMPFNGLHIDESVGCRLISPEVCSRAPSLLKWTLTDDEKTSPRLVSIINSASLSLSLSRSKLCFMGTVRPESFICHLSKSNYTPHRECQAFYFSTASLPLKCELQTSQASLSLPPSLPVLLLFTMFYSFFLSARLFYLSLALLFSLSLAQPSRPLTLVVHCISPS